MNKVNVWDKNRGKIITKKGGRWEIGKGVTSHGYSIMDELVGHVSHFQVLIMHVVGYLPERRLADWLEAIYICLSWPDPRIWPNQIGSLGGTTKTSPVAATCVGTLAADSSIYGPGTILDSSKFIMDAMNWVKQGNPIEGFLESRKKGEKITAPGYIRPYAKGDERIEPMQRTSNNLGFEIGEYLSLGYKIQDILFKQYDGERMNLAGYVCSFLLDQGFTQDQIYRVCSLTVNAGVIACYSEAADKEPESFLPLQCKDIEYCGVEEREVPE